MPRTAAWAQEQYDKSMYLRQLLETLYPGRSFQHMKKYHNAMTHVISIGPCLGAWELVSTNPFEMANKISKRIALQQTNHKNMDKQVALFTLQYSNQCDLYYATDDLTYYLYRS